MEMTTRMKQILQLLLQESAAVSVKYLAEQIGVSRRTVQRELESIGASLKGYELTFVSKTGVGIWIEGGGAGTSSAYTGDFKGKGTAQVILLQQ